MTKRLIALLLTVSLMISCTLTLASCGNAEEGPSESRTEAATEADTLDARRSTPDTLPDGLRFDGAVVRILTRAGDEDTKMEFIAEKDASEIVEASVYERNTLVEERFGLTFEYIRVDDATRHDGGKVNNLVSKTVSTGTDEYDIVSNHMSQTTTSVLNGYFRNLTPLEYFDWSQPWWNQSYQEEVIVGDRQYMAVGELALSYISGMYVMYFNKALWDKYFMNEPELYETVRQKKWTLDRLTSYVTDFNQDVDGKPGNSEGDLVGMYYQGPSIMSDGFAGAANIQFSHLDKENADYEFVLNNDRTMDFVDKMRVLLFESDGIYIGGDDFANALKKLSENTAVFTPQNLGGTLYLRSMADDYGIIPLPMLDEAQGEYTGFVHNGFSVFSIPATVKDPDCIAATLEALSAESYRRVTPAYYDTALKFKYARDPEAADMLDTISAGIKFDFCYVYNASVGSVTSLFRNMFANSSSILTASSTIKSYDKSTVKQIKALVKNLQKLKV